MDLRLNFKIAKTHLLSRKKQTIVAALGVTFGIAMFIFMISFMTGVNKLLEETTLTAAPHIRLYNDVSATRPNVVDYIYKDNTFKVVHHQRPREDNLNLKDGFQILNILQNDPRVMGASPLLSSQVFYNYGSQQINGIIAGVDIMEEDKLFKIHEKMVAGEIDNLLSSSNGIIMGVGLAKKLNAGLGDHVSITTPKGVQLSLNVVGLLQTGISAIDDMKSYANLSTAQRILQRDTRYITDINLKLHDIDQAKAVAKEYSSKFGYKAEDWETANATILLSFTLRNAITFAVVCTLLIVAGFGIYNIMNMTIYEKMKDIAILKATGFSGVDVRGIFMSESLVIGLSGGLLGLLIGFLISFGVSKIPFHADGLINIDHFPVNFDIKYYIYGIGFGLLTTGFAGWMPSKKAARIDPVEIIRGK